MTRIVISEFMDAAAVENLRRRFDAVYDPGLAERRGELLARLESADALIVRNRTRVDTGLLAAAPALKVVGRLGVGLDNIDLTACRERKVSVIPATGANANAVAEYVIAATLILLRGAYHSSEWVAAGGWPREHLSDGRELAGKTLGIIGFGNTGQLSAQKAVAFGARVIAFDPAIAADAPVWRQHGAAPTSLDELLAESDVVSLHLPLTPETHKLLDRRRLASMKRDAILINTARGGIVDEHALGELLRSGHLGGAALDVFADEPLPAGSPLAGCPNLLLTPHIAGVTRESNQRVSQLVAEKIAAFFANT